MSGSLISRLSFLISLITILCVLVLSTFALAQHSSSGHIKRSHNSGGYSHNSHTGGSFGFVKSNRSFNAQYSSSGVIHRNNSGLRLNSHNYQDVLRSGVRVGNSVYNAKGFNNRNARRFNNGNIKSIQHNQKFVENRRIQHVQQRRDVKNEGYSYGTNPRYQRNVRRTNQFNSDSDLYYVDQNGYSILSTNNNNIADSYYDDDFRQIVVIQGEGGSPACPEGHECGYRLYENGTGPRIITLGTSLEGLPPQDGLNGGPKVITLD